MCFSSCHLQAYLLNQSPFYCSPLVCMLEGVGSGSAQRYAIAKVGVSVWSAVVITGVGSCIAVSKLLLMF